jgi:hypothetical protein
LPFLAFAMNPPDAHSSLAALRQLKEMLDAGTITPAEFETLKRQIVFGAEPALPITPPAAEEPASPAATATPVPPLASPEPLAPYAPIAVNAPEAPSPASPTTEPDWLASTAPNLLPADEESLPPAEERRNPLNLVFAIGGLVVFLGVVAYLLMGRPAASDEHLSSGTQTAADSAAVVPEVGPQAEQITLAPAAAPETIRVAPVTQPVPTRAASQFRADSMAAAASPAAKAPATTPAAGSITVTDSSSTSKAP